MDQFCSCLSHPLPINAKYVKGRNDQIGTQITAVVA